MSKSSSTKHEWRALMWTWWTHEPVFIGFPLQPRAARWAFRNATGMFKGEGLWIRRLDCNQSITVRWKFISLSIVNLIFNIPWSAYLERSICAIVWFYLYKMRIAVDLMTHLRERRYRGHKGQFYGNERSSKEHSSWLALTDLWSSCGIIAVI